MFSRFVAIGSRSVVAGTLGYTVDTLPAFVDFASTATGSDQ